MDIKINAQGRYVEVTNIKESMDLDYVANVVYDLWAATDLIEKEDKEGNKLGAASSVYMERPASRFGFAYMPGGERLNVK